MGPRTKNGLPKHCSWNVDRHGKRRVRFRKRSVSIYLTDTPWGEAFMRQYAAALANGERVMLLTRQHVQQIVNAKASTPSAQRNFLFTIRAMFQWAFKEGRVPDDPTRGITREKIRTTGYPTWSECEIERFETVHPIGGKARLAFAAALHRPAARRCGADGAAAHSPRHPDHRSAQD